MSEALENQTIFAQTEPVFQDPEQLPVDPQKEAQIAQSKKKQKIVLFTVLGVFGFVLILVVLLLSMKTQRTQTQIKETPTPEATEKPTLSPLQQSIKDSTTLINAADPSINEYPFPPINFEMTLEPEKN